MIKIILISIALHVIALLLSGQIHEMGHRLSLLLFKRDFEKKPFRTIIPNYELLNKSERIHMYMTGIFTGGMTAGLCCWFAPLAPILYLIGCRTDMKEIKKEIEK